MQDLIASVYPTIPYSPLTIPAAFRSSAYPAETVYDVDDVMASTSIRIKWDNFYT